DFFAYNDCALLIEANHVQRVLTSIDTNRVGNGDCLAGHGGCAPRALRKPLNWLCEPLGAGARPVHPIRVNSRQRSTFVAFGAKRTWAGRPAGSSWALLTHSGHRQD